MCVESCMRSPMVTLLCQQHSPAAPWPSQYDGRQYRTTLELPKERVTRSQRAKVSLVSLSIGRLKVSARHPSRLRFLWATLAVLCCNHLGRFHLHRSYSSSTCLARCGLPGDKAHLDWLDSIVGPYQGPGLKQAPSCRLAHVIIFSILYDCLGFRNGIEFIHTHDHQ